MTAAWTGQENTLQILLQKNADSLVQSQFGETALSLARETHHQKIVRSLGSQ